MGTKGDRGRHGWGRQRFKVAIVCMGTQLEAEPGSITLGGQACA